MTNHQLDLYPRVVRSRKKKTPALRKCPQKKGYCLKIVIKSPKKPHSARRKTTRVYLTSTKQSVYCYIPSSGHKLQKHSVVLVRGGRRRDIPGMKYTLIRGARRRHFSFGPPLFRRKARSKYGLNQSYIVW